MPMEKERKPITEDWLRSVGFKWHQIERQPTISATSSTRMRLWQ